MKGIGLLILFIFVIGCQSKQNTFSSKLSDEQLARLMLDIHLGEVAMPGLTTANKDSLRTIYMSKLEKQYNLTFSELQIEIEELEMDPKKYEMIVERMIAIHDSLR